MFPELSIAPTVITPLTLAGKATPLKQLKHPVRGFQLPEEKTTTQPNAIPFLTLPRVRAPVIHPSKAMAPGGPLTPLKPQELLITSALPKLRFQALFIDVAKSPKVSPPTNIFIG